MDRYPFSQGRQDVYGAVTSRAGSPGSPPQRPGKTFRTGVEAFSRPRREEGMLVFTQRGPFPSFTVDLQQ
jgi:hypothetical protein